MQFYGISNFFKRPGMHATRKRVYSMVQGTGYSKWLVAKWLRVSAPRVDVSSNVKEDYFS